MGKIHRNGAKSAKLRKSSLKKQNYVQNGI